MTAHELKPIDEYDAQVLVIVDECVNLGDEVERLKAENQRLRDAGNEVMLQHRTQDGMHARLLCALVGLDCALMGVPTEEYSRPDATGRYTTVSSVGEGVARG